jgi:hypothetical protein
MGNGKKASSGEISYKTDDPVKKPPSVDGGSIREQGS